jgi:hypothetical protein
MSLESDVRLAHVCGQFDAADVPSSEASVPSSLAHCRWAAGTEVSVGPLKCNLYIPGHVHFDFFHAFDMHFSFTARLTSFTYFFVIAQHTKLISLIFEQMLQFATDSK